MSNPILRIRHMVARHCSAAVEPPQRHPQSSALKTNNFTHTNTAKQCQLSFNFVQPYRGFSYEMSLLNVPHTHTYTNTHLTSTRTCLCVCAQLMS